MYTQFMYAFFIIVMVLLPPTSAVNRSQPLHRFTITSNAVFTGEGECYQAVERTEEYINEQLPTARVHIEPDCYILELYGI